MRQFLYVNTDGDFEETINAFEVSDFVNISTGVGDAGKPILLNSSGIIDAGMVDYSSIDHGGLLGLADDDHAHYLLADGTRDVLGLIAYSSALTFNNDRQLIDKGYADAIAAGFGPKRAVRVATTSDLTATTTYNNGASGVGATLTNSGTQAALVIDGINMAANDRVLVREQDSATLENGLYTVTNIGSGSTNWVLTRATDFDNSPDGEIIPGDFVPVEEGTTYSGYQFYQVDFDTGNAVGTDPITFTVFSNPTDLTAGNGIDIAANVVSVDLAAAIPGLSFSASDLTIDWATTFTVNGADDKAFKASDIASTTINEGAAIVGSNDAGSYYTSNNVEGILQEVGSAILSSGVSYTAGTGGITKGDLVYVSSNNTILPYATITASQACIGIAEATVAAGVAVKVRANDTVLDGYTGLAAGTKYYWTGSGWTANFSSFSSGDHIYMGGVSKNATSIHTEVMYIMKKA